jgi:hypothetical protein
MRRDPRNHAPDLFSFARDYLRTYMPKVRGLSTKTIEAYRISLECYLGYLAENEHVRADRVSFDHFDRQQSQYGSIDIASGNKRTVGVARDSLQAGFVRDSEGVWLVQNIQFLENVSC